MTTPEDVYASPSELKAHMGNQAVGFESDASAVLALAAASRDLDAWCRRRFWKSADPVTRIYYGDSVTGLAIDDAWEVVSMTVDGTSVDLSDFDLWPLNGVKDGIEGWPTECIRSQEVPGAATFEGRCAVTLKPGWLAVPDPGKLAVLMLGAENLRMGDVPFGVAGVGPDGFAVRVARLNPLVVAKLMAYQRTEEVVVG